MTNFIFKTILAIVFIIGVLTCSHATDYYVDQNSLGGSCNNNNPGTLTQPFCSMNAITSMISNGQLNPGDVIYIRTGTYPFVSIDNLNGTSGNPIVFINYQGEQVVFDAKHPNSSQPVSFRLNNCTHIEVNGLEMINATELYGGSLRLNNSNYNRIINNHVHHNKQGTDQTWTSGIALSKSSYNLIQNNEVNENNYVGILTVSSNTDPNQKSVYNQYLDNHVHHNYGMGQHSDGIGFNGAYTSNCTISRNLVHDNEDDGIDTWASNSHTITHNIVYNTGLLGQGDGNGFKLGGADQGVAPGGHFVAYNISYNNTSDGFESNGSGGSFLYNNISYDNGGSGMLDTWRNAGQSGYNVLKNNIFMNNALANLTVNSAQVTGLDHNIYYQTNGAPIALFNGTNYNSLSAYQNASGMDNNSLEANPQFVDLSNYDFHLSNGSPAIDAGDPSNPGGETVQGSAPDIGVFEYVGGNPPPISTKYYVDLNSLGGNCSNNNPGSLTQPFCNMDAITLRANNGQLNPGDSIFIRTGTYKFTSINNVNGAPGDLIVFINYNGENPVFDAAHPNSSTVEHAFRLINCTYIEVNGLEMINAYGLYGGSLRLNDSDHNRLLNNHVHHNKQGNNQTWTSGIQLARSSYNLVQNNLVHDNNYVGILTTSSSTDPNKKAVQNQILDNHVYNHSGMGEHSDGIGFSGAYVSNCTISRNLVHDNEDDGIDTWSSNSHTITHNIVYNTGLLGLGDGNGFKLGGADVGVEPGGHFVAYNITYNNASDGFDMNGSGGSFLYDNVSYGNGDAGILDTWRNAGQSGYNVLRNNIFMNNTLANIQVNGAQVSNLDHNLYYQTNGSPIAQFNGTNYYSLSAYQNASGMDNNSLGVNPQFVDLVNFDFHLSPGSPAIDAGDPSNPGGDPFLGNAPEIGVYESGRTELSIRCFLEGAYDPASGLMTDVLRAKSLVPVTNPWGQGPDITTTAYGVTGNNALVDWVQIELRDVNDFSTVLYSTSGLVQRDGDVVQSDGTSLVELGTGVPGDFYLVIKHKSHLHAMSHVPVTLVNSVASYDFTAQNGYTTSSTSQGELQPGIWGLFTGNGSTDNDINGQDKVLWALENGLFSIYSAQDFNMDADISAADKVIWAPNNGLFSEVP